MALERALGSKSANTVWPRAIALPVTFIAVVLGWVVFRSISISSALDMYVGLFGFNGFGITSEIAWQIRNSELAMLAVAAIISFFSVVSDWRFSRLSAPAQAFFFTLLGVLALTRMASQSFSPFLYFQF